MTAAQYNTQDQLKVITEKWDRDNAESDWTKWTLEPIEKHNNSEHAKSKRAESEFRR